MKKVIPEKKTHYHVPTRYFYLSQVEKSFQMPEFVKVDL
jgi:hypothetical protein